MSARRPIVSTCRLQLNADFGFEHARRAAPYLKELGVSALYTSPIVQARRGSGHGYDVVDPTRISTELGGEAQFQAMVEELRRLGMGLIVDMVPNHMAAHTENPWWRSMLEDGPASPHARVFDVDWSPRKGEAGRITLPILGAPAHDIAAAGEFRPGVDERGFSIRYHDHDLPVDPATWPLILKAGRRESDSAPAPIVELERAAAQVGARTPEAAAVRLRSKETAIAALHSILDENGSARVYLDERLRTLSRDPNLLLRLLDRQAYELDFWRKGLRTFNYRRFFDVSDLAGVRVEDPEIFEKTHGLHFRLIREGAVNGVRLDHIDGLRDPWAYLHRLRERLDAETPGGAAERRPPVYVEKILCGDESLPQDWPVEGATGYEFLRDVGAVIVHPQGARAMEAHFARITGDQRSFEAVEHETKRAALEKLLSREVRALAQSLAGIASESAGADDFNMEQLERAIIALSASLPVYRTYIRAAAVCADDRARIDRAASLARESMSASDLPALDFLLGVILCDDANSDKPHREARRDFVLRWQQLTGPAMAKGHEDTALYVYTPHLCANDVGCDPGEPAIPVETLHERLLLRSRRWPLSMTTTSTHDTKRGEDARARLAALTEYAEEWAERLETWRAVNEPKLQHPGGSPAPDDTEQILIYQTLLGAWPMDGKVDQTFIERVQDYLIKAAREAKVHTNWLEPDETHEQALRDFAATIIADDAPGGFVEEFLSFQRRIAFRGVVNSLSQTLLRIAAPGVPDLYQGSELWNLSLVDPDNRAPVDFEGRRRMLDAIRRDAAADPDEFLHDALEHWRDGRIKLHTTARALHARCDHAALFTEGEYIPLQTSGAGAAHVVAFARRMGAAWAIAIAPRLTRSLSPDGVFPLAEHSWGNTAVLLPDGAPGAWRNALTDEATRIDANGAPEPLKLANVLAHFPVALLISA